MLSVLNSRQHRDEGANQKMSKTFATYQARHDRKAAAKLLKAFNRNTYVIHEDDYRVVLASGFEDDSTNEKTGAMIQTWILAKADKPSSMIKHGLDSVVCGSCWKRPKADHSNPEPIDYALAESQGWRAFVTVAKGQRLENHAVCPASNESKADRKAKGIDKDVTCATCGLCKGNATSARSITIEKHGQHADRCYVSMKAPNSIYRAWKAGRYAKLVDLSMLAGKRVRFGSYGDPVYIPFPIVKAIASVAKNYTGYTHQWQRPQYRAYAQFFMASTNAA